METELKKLWKKTFHDTDAYIDFFFKEIDLEKNVLYYEKKGRITSVLYMLPYKMTLNKEILPVTYICGVTTVPEERGKGLMNSLLQRAHQEIKKKGDAFSILIPASSELFLYYAKMGYATMFYYENVYPERVLPENNHLSQNSEYQTEIPLPGLFEFFDKQLHKRNAGVLHSYPDFVRILQEMEIAGGKLKTWTNNKEEIEGMAFIYPKEEKDTYIIKEFLYKDENNKNYFLNLLSQELGTNRYALRQPVNKGKAIPFGMVYPTGNIQSPFLHTTKGFMSLMLE